MELTKAHNQWANRPADQRFWNLAELLEATKAHHAAAVEAECNISDLRVEAVDGNVQISGKSGATAELTNWAFGQLAQRAGAPAGYLRELPATLAVQNINHGLKQRGADDAPATLLLHKNGGYFARAILSGKYGRIWNHSIVDRLMGLEADGWKVPPAYVPWNGCEGIRTRVATPADAALSLTVREGQTIAPAGLYASFEDMFAFMVNPERVIRDGSAEGLLRGVMVWNSEVGKATFGMQTFYFRGVCGNHIIWDAEDVKELRLRHIGDGVDGRAFAGLELELKKYLNSSALDTEAKIDYARKFVLKGKTAEEVVDFIFGQRILTRKDAVAAYKAVVPEVDGDPYTAWGYAQGITRLSQTTKNADSRVELDRAAGKVLKIAF